MSERLLRALQGGGLTTPIERDLWGVWRGRDRRRRMIGTFSGAEVEVLRLQSRLAPLGDGVPPVLIWSGPLENAETTGPGNARILNPVSINAEGPLLELLMSHCRDASQRAGYRTLAESYLADHEAASACGNVPGMNWRGLVLGGRVQGGQVLSGRPGAQTAAQARSRLAQVTRALSEPDLVLIVGLILRVDSKAALAKRLHIRQALVERRAIAALRALERIYATLARAGD